MEAEKFFVAIDLGSTKITGALARKTPEGKIDILACETVDAKSIIDCGEIRNTGETASKIKDIINKLNANKILQENELEITTVYVALGGHSITSGTRTNVRLLGKGDEVSKKMIEEMYAENYNLEIENAEIFGVFKQEYLVDDKLEYNPVGMNCFNLQGRYVIVYGKPILKFNLDSLQKVGDLKLVNEQLAPIASSLAALTDEDIEKGCVFIDFGAETTSVCVYFRGYLRQLFVVPYGGSSVTEDIVKELNMLQADAEKMKIKFGNAMPETEEDRTIIIPSNRENENVPEISTLFVSQVIEARIKEILDLIWKEITEAGLSRYLGAGFVIAGAASKLKNLDKLIELQTGCSAYYADFHKRLELSENNKFSNFDNAVVLGLLMLTNESCVVKKEKPIVSEPEEKKENVFMKFAKRMKKKVDNVGSLFDEVDENINTFQEK